MRNAPPVADDDCARQYIGQASSLTCTVARQLAFLIAGVTGLAHPTGVGDAHRWLLIPLCCWAVYRLATRAQSAVANGADYGWAVATALLMPALSSAAEMHLTTITVPQAIVSVCIGTLTVQTSPRWSLPGTGLLVAVYAVRGTQLTGAAGLLGLDDLYVLVVSALVALVARTAIRRIAAGAEAAHRDRIATEVDEAVAAARRDYAREQLALLHDTAATTLLLAADCTGVSDDRLAARAASDVALLKADRSLTDRRPVDVVAELRALAAVISVPTQFVGWSTLWLEGEVASAVGHAAREVFNNVHRHACASRVVVTVGPDYLRIGDDGVGFDPASPRAGHGVDSSIRSRMASVAAQATIDSTRGRGTTVTLSWGASARPEPKPVPAEGNPLDLERFRAIYGLTLVGLALSYLVLSVPWCLFRGRHPVMELVLAVGAGVLALGAVKSILRPPCPFATAVMVTLTAIAVTQLMLLNPAKLSTEANWAQAAVGFCLIPHTLRCSSRRAAAMVLVCWAVPSAVSLARNPTLEMVTFLGLGVASYLIPQLGLTLFNVLYRRAAAATECDTEARMQILRAERVAQAKQDAHVRRYAAVIDRLVPLLEALSTAPVIGEDLRQRARAEICRLRVLFDAAHTDNAFVVEEVQRLISDAEARGVVVDADIGGGLPEVTDETERRLAEWLTAVLARPRRRARVTVMADGDAIECSVVYDVGADQAWVTFRTDVTAAEGKVPLLAGVAS